MTVTREKDGFYCTCDVCDDVFEEVGETFAQLIHYLQSSSWVPSKDEATGEWEHTCPDCITSRNRANRVRTKVDKLF